jgi:hypothetical protein
MDQIITTLLVQNNYTAIGSPDDNVHVYESDGYKDVIIVAPYTIKDLYEFEGADVTKKVMKAFDLACKVNPNALKDTSLILCLETTRSGELKEAQNIILTLEENIFGFRKYVLPYSQQAISNLSSIQTDLLDSEIYSKLEAGFNEYENSDINGRTVTEYDVVMNLFVKLPFMMITGRDQQNEQISLQAYLNEKLEPYQSTLDLAVWATNEYQSKAEEKQYSGESSTDFDLQLDELLSSDPVQKFLEDNKGSKK